MTALAIGPTRVPLTVPTNGCRAITATALALAGVGHAAAAAAHAGSLSAVAFFVATSIAQLALAGLVLRRHRVTRLVVGSSLALVGLWAVSRTVGVSVGHAHGGPEAVAPLDVGVAAAQVVAVVATLALTRVARAVVVSAAAGLSAALLLVATLSPGAASSHDHGHQADHGAHPGAITAVEPAASSPAPEPLTGSHPVAPPQPHAAVDSHDHGCEPSCAPHPHP